MVARGLHEPHANAIIVACGSRHFTDRTNKVKNLLHWFGYCAIAVAALPNYCINQSNVQFSTKFLAKKTSKIFLAALAVGYFRFNHVKISVSTNY